MQTTLITFALACLALAAALLVLSTAVRIARDPFARYGLSYLVKDLGRQLTRGIR